MQYRIVKRAWKAGINFFNRTCKHILCASTVVMSLAAITPVIAQYPHINSEVAAESSRRTQAANARSDSAWARAQEAIREWAARGKPYISNADNPSDLPQAPIPAFPGAQGGGMYSYGGRGGQVFVVSNLNDSGSGSFREACQAGGPRVVVFNVAGLIKLKDPIRIRAPYITISGATAPGDGICIAGNTVEVETHDVIIRHMRFRRGDRWVGDRNDSLGGHPIGNIIIDHVSASWGLDENLSMYRHEHQTPEGNSVKLPTVNITIQYSIFSEALNTYNHAFGSTLGGYNATFHHNLWANNTGRNPSVGMIYDFTLANNVVYNWRHRTVDGGDHRSFYTIINNYFKPGPVTPPSGEIRFRILKPESRRAKPPVDDYGIAYVEGNIVEGNPRVTADNWNGGVQPNPQGDRTAVLAQLRLQKPYPHAYLKIQSAQAAYNDVLANSGATRPRRDAVDQRIIEMVRTGKVSSKASAETAKQFEGVGYSEKLIAKLIHQVSLGIITDPEQVGGYPEYKGTPYRDTDNDGLPDDWETRYGLNPGNPADATADSNGDGYTNIEEFINGHDPTALPERRGSNPRTYVDLWKTNPDLQERLKR